MNLYRSGAIVNKRTFLNVLSAAIASPVIAPLFAWMTKENLTNWAGNLSYSTGRVHEAATVGQIRSLLHSEDK
jgi:alditol oxidase